MGLSKVTHIVQVQSRVTKTEHPVCLEQGQVMSQQKVLTLRVGLTTPKNENSKVRIIRAGLFKISWTTIRTREWVKRSSWMTLRKSITSRTRQKHKRNCCKSESSESNYELSWTSFKRILKRRIRERFATQRTSCPFSLSSKYTKTSKWKLRRLKSSWRRCLSDCEQLRY